MSKFKVKAVWTGIIFLLGAIASAILVRKRREEDILSDVANKIDFIENESKQKGEEFTRKVEIIKAIEDKTKRMEELLRLWKELDED